LLLKKNGRGLRGIAAKIGSKNLLGNRVQRNQGFLGGERGKKKGYHVNLWLEWQPENQVVHTKGKHDFLAGGKSGNGGNSMFSQKSLLRKPSQKKTTQTLLLKPVRSLRVSKKKDSYQVP